MNSFNKKLIDFLKKVSIILLIIILTFPILPVKKAEAIDAVSVISSVSDVLISAGNAILAGVQTFAGKIFDASNALVLKEYTLDTIAYNIARIAIHSITASIIDWINSGFQGNPAFIQNPGRFFANVADEELGRMLMADDNYAWMCSPFRFQLQKALIYNRSFRERSQCTITGVVQNFQDFATSFNNSLGNLGGWDTWNTIATEPQNNPYGAYALLNVEVDARINGSIDRNKNLLNWGKGFFSWKDPACVEKANAASKAVQNDTFDGIGSTPDTGLPQEQSGSGSDREVNTDPDNCKMLTPGSVIAETVNKTVGSGEDQLVQADEINEIVSALMYQLAIKALGGSGLFGLGASSNNSSSQSYTAQLAADEQNFFSNNKNSTIDQIMRSIDTENVYSGIKNDTLVRVSYSAGNASKAISCFVGKIGTSTSLFLTDADKDYARGQIALATSTYNFINSYQTSVKRDLDLSSANIKSLQNIVDKISNLQYQNQEQLSIIMQQYATLTASIHNEGDIITARYERDSDIPAKLKSAETEIDQILINCADFPNNRRSYNSYNND